MIQKKLEDTTTRVKALYEQHQKYLPLISFFAGFLWDSLTLDRIDLFWTDFVLGVYVALAGVFIIIMNFVTAGVLKDERILRFAKWYPNLIQFFFGGLFSSFVVFYFMSASWSKNSIFLIFMAVLLVSNEFIKDRLNNLLLQFGYFFLALFSFLIFILPVVFKSLSPWLFVLGGALSMLILGGMLYLLINKAPDIYRPQLKSLQILLAAIYVVYNVFYFTNVIPPVPLSLKTAGIYHHVQRKGNQYELRFEKGAWYNFFKTSDSDFHFAPGDTVFCFASVFAPTRLDTHIRQYWQYYNRRKQQWQTTDRMSYPIHGGRDGGYRGYTYKRHLMPGDWRVQIQTGRGQLLGETSFTLIADSSAHPALETDFR